MKKRGSSLEELIKKIILLLLTCFVIVLFFGKYYVSEVKNIEKDFEGKKVEIPY